MRYVPQQAENVRWGGHGVVADCLDERGGDRVRAHAGVGRQHPLHGRIGAPQHAVEGRRHDIAGQQGDTEALVSEVQRGGSLFRAHRGAWREARAATMMPANATTSARSAASYSLGSAPIGREGEENQTEAGLPVGRTFS